eukprot:76089_1
MASLTISWTCPRCSSQNPSSSSCGTCNCPHPTKQCTTCTFANAWDTLQCEICETKFDQTPQIQAKNKTNNNDGNTMDDLEQLLQDTVSELMQPPLKKQKIETKRDPKQHMQKQMLKSESLANPQTRAEYKQIVLSNGLWEHTPSIIEAFETSDGWVWTRNENERNVNTERCGKWLLFANDTKLVQIKKRVIMDLKNKLVASAWKCAKCEATNDPSYVICAHCFNEKTLGKQECESSEETICSTWLDYTWLKVVYHTKTGSLGNSAKVAAHLSGQRNTLICIYTHDYADRKHVLAVANNINKNIYGGKMKRSIYYKADAQTLTGQYGCSLYKYDPKQPHQLFNSK